MKRQRNGDSFYATTRVPLPCWRWNSYGFTNSRAEVWGGLVTYRQCPTSQGSQALLPATANPGTGPLHQVLCNIPASSDRHSLSKEIIKHQTLSQDDLGPVCGKE